MTSRMVATKWIRPLATRRTRILQVWRNNRSRSRHPSGNGFSLDCHQSSSDRNWLPPNFPISLQLIKSISLFKSSLIGNHFRNSFHFRVLGRANGNWTASDLRFLEERDVACSDGSEGFNLALTRWCEAIEM